MSTGSSLTLAGNGKKVVVSAKNIVFTDGGETEEVPGSPHLLRFRFRYVYYVSMSHGASPRACFGVFDKETPSTVRIVLARRESCFAEETPIVLRADYSADHSPHDGDAHSDGAPRRGRWGITCDLDANQYLHGVSNLCNAARSNVLSVGHCWYLFFFLGDYVLSNAQCR